MNLARAIAMYSKSTILPRTLFAAVLILCLSEARSDERARPWPFNPLPEIAIPHLRNGHLWHNRTARTAIDAFVTSALDAHKITPAPEASRLTLVRRLYFDVLGLPPDPEEIQRFRIDERPDAYERLIDRLLADTRYGERWGRFWLDLARYADTAGYEGDPDLPHAWRYRDYVIDAFNQDKPYDVFVKEQIAGDEMEEIMGAGDLPETSPERVVALTFLRLAPFTEPRGDESRHELLSEMTSTVSSVFLGLTVGCAKCHDHKYVDIPTRDFYRMKAFFATVSLPRPEPGDGFQIGGPLPAKFYRPGEAEWAARQQSLFELQIEDAKRELAELTTRLERQVAGQAGKNLKSILSDVNDNLISADDRQRHSYLSSRERFLRQQIKRLQPLAMSVRHSYGPPYESGVPLTHVMIRGEYDNLGPAVEPGFLTCITGDDQPAKIRLDPFKRWPTRSRRMTLAQWIADADNPLTARVMVNRIWQWHFGRGLVASTSDFGSLSGEPSHSDLLDWLARQFVQSNWSVKSVQRQILTSHTYRQSSSWQDDRAMQLDSENTWLWRFNRRQLEAEAIRDSVLQVSGRLNPTQFGLPIFPPLPDGIEERVKFTNSKWDTQRGDDGRRRSVYIYQQRTLTMPLMQVFDALVCDESRPIRRNSVTPLQALELWNGNMVQEEAVHFANLVESSAPDVFELQVEYAFMRALGRPPSPIEFERLQDFVRNSPGERPLVGLSRVLYNCNEFVHVD